MLASFDPTVAVVLDGLCVLLVEQVYAKLHLGHRPKSAGASSYLLLLVASASVVTRFVAFVLFVQE